jgi:LmbE family N-acetylglucosaminyl deacetylase
MTPKGVSELGTILGVWAHPDDEAFLSAGVMALATAAGARVVCITATRGEAGAPESGLTPPEVGRLREAELRASLDLLGVDEHHWLDYVDGCCAEVDPAEASTRLQEIVEDVAPDTILTFGPEGFTDHPDHKAVSSWVTRAVSQLSQLGRPTPRVHHAAQTVGWAEVFRPRLAEHHVFPPDFPPLWPEHALSIEVALPTEIVTRKVEALRAQASQIDRLIDAVGEDFFQQAFSAERFSPSPA